MASSETDEEAKKEYEAILSIFESFLNNILAGEDKWGILEDLMNLRAEFAINHAIKGFNIGYEEAIELLRGFNNGLTEDDRNKRNVLIAAIDNLVDFSVAEEFQMNDEIEDIISQKENKLSYEEREEALLAVCKKYNYTYSKVENSDIEYSMYVASFLIAKDENTYLTYMTMGDERVRPWHLALEGTTYKKRDFPAWLVPPIEHNCRCFLITSDDTSASVISDVVAKQKISEMPSFVDPTFKECVAFGGRIFSNEHSYFLIPIQYKGKLREIAKRIKSKYYVSGV